MLILPKSFKYMKMYVVFQKLPILLIRQSISVDYNYETRNTIIDYKINISVFRHFVKVNGSQSMRFMADMFIR